MEKRAEWPAKGKLWSLADVQRLKADFFTGACLELEQLIAIPYDESGWDSTINLSVSTIRRECKSVGFLYLAEKADEILLKLQLIGVRYEKEDASKEDICFLLRELGKDINRTLSQCMFLRVATDKIPFYSVEDSPRFGKEVAQWLPNSTYHICEASRCFALERWDSCVHHLMLAVELALRKWGKNFKRQKKAPIHLVDWKPIIDAAEDELKRLRNMPKTTKRTNQISKLAEQVSSFGCIKDAYRNISAHGREKYDERRALNIMRYTEAFMQALIKKRGT